MDYNVHLRGHCQEHMSHPRKILSTVSVPSKHLQMERIGPYGGEFPILEVFKHIIYDHILGLSEGQLHL